MEERGPYNSIIMDHFAHPRNMGEMESPDGVGEATNPVCGDTMRLYIKVEGDRIVEARSLAFGCVGAIAASSMTTEILTGKTLDEALLVSKEAIAEALGGLPPTKAHCSVLAEKTLQSAVADYQRRRGD